MWACVGAAAAAAALMIGTAGVYANATVSAGDARGRSDCGTVWDPNAVTTACADALTQRSWTAIVLLGLGLLGATGAVVVAGRSPDRSARQLGALAAAIAVVVIVGGLAWAGAIDRTVGT